MQLCRKVLPFRQLSPFVLYQVTTCGYENKSFQDKLLKRLEKSVFHNRMVNDLRLLEHYPNLPERQDKFYQRRAGANFLYSVSKTSVVTFALGFTWLS